ncbi:hypothetical protein BJ508DRAFT_20766 [Ascobolus immersus RN42]|uniref:Hydrophobin n=1 Tax=Ascobolus immersus RN42 TaxID=1160509 RepID=A0A3N4IFP5_ASCIM|nr:hypothetical protein BJ508DRAFT_20766 [Ascobolus immersus RN42]
MTRFRLVLCSILAAVASTISSEVTDHNIANNPQHSIPEGGAARQPYRTRKITQLTCPRSQRPHCCADFAYGQTEITKLDTCMPLLPGDTCKAQTVCCIVLQGVHDSTKHVMRRYGCGDVTMLEDFTDPREHWYGFGAYPLERTNTDIIRGYDYWATHKPDASEKEQGNGQGKEQGKGQGKEQGKEPAGKAGTAKSGQTDTDHGDEDENSQSGQASDNYELFALHAEKGKNKGASVQQEEDEGSDSEYEEYSTDEDTDDEA